MYIPSVVRLSFSVALFALFVLGCQGEDGQFDLSLSWGPEGPPSEPEATIFARVVEAEQGTLRVLGRALFERAAVQEAEPVRVAGRSELVFRQVPNGDGLVVIVEVRASLDRRSELLLYGVSAPFSLRAGEGTTVEVLVGLVRPPGGPGRAGVGVDVATVTTAEALVGSPAVDLRLRTDAGVLAIVSNFEGFPSGTEARPLRRSFRLEDPEDPACVVRPGTDRPCAYTISWDLNLGLENDCGLDPARGFARDDRCLRRVFVAFEDENGQRSGTLFQDVVLDTKPPALVEEGTGVEPASARPDGPVSVSLAFDEPVSPSLVELRVEGSTVAFPRVFPPGSRPGDTTSLRYRLPRADRLEGPGPFRFSVAAEDRVGNALSRRMLLETLTVDGEPPRIGGLELLRPLPPEIGRTPRAAEGAVVEVRFFVENEDLERSGVDVRLQDLPLDCGPGPFVRNAPIVCRTAPLPRPLVPATQNAEVVVRVEDGAGNVSEASAPVVLDFEPPRIDAVDVRYVPGPGNLLSEVTAARDGSTVALRLTFDEGVPAPPDVLELALTPPAGSSQTLRFDRVRGARTAVSASYEAVIPSGFPSGDYVEEAAPCLGALCGTYRASLPLVDAAGNEASLVRFSGATLRIRVGAPDLVVDQAQVSYVRSPVGSAAAETLGAFVRPAGPFFALAPGDPFAQTSTLGAQAFVFSGGRRPVALRVFADPARASLLSTLIRPDRIGTWDRARLRLSGTDAPSVYVTGIDEAGNESAAVRIERAWLVATPGQTSGGRIFHPTSTSPGRRLPLEPGTEVSDPVSVAAPDGVFEVRDAERVWTLARQTGLATDVGAHAVAYDRARGQVVRFDALFDDTETWDGVAWTLALASGPGRPRLEDLALAYDGVRGRTVLFGANAQTWAWDGAIWLDRTPASSPSPRNRHAMAFDGRRGRVVLFGGEDASGFFGDTWTYDGAAWTLVSGAGGPSPRAGHAMAFDAARGEVVLFGGRGASGLLADTWAFDGAAWMERVTTGGPPAAREGHGLAYDEADGELVVVAGNGRRDTWVLSGAEWVERAALGPAFTATTSVEATYDARADRVLLSSGSETWLFDGAGWSNESLGAELPGFDQLFGSGAAYDESRRRLVFLGVDFFTQSTVVWEWDGRTWRNETPSSVPPARSLGVLAYDPDARRVVLFGGGDLDLTTPSPSARDTWAWDGSTFTDLTQASGNPPARQLHALRYDTARGQLVLFGGFGVQENFADTWIFEDGLWAISTPTTNPGSRAGHAMAFSPEAGRMFVFGGVEGPASTYAWDGQNWADVSSDPSPVDRAFSLMVYDEGTEEVLLFGGRPSVATGSRQLSDTWTFDGTRWRELIPSTVEGPSSADAMFYDAERGHPALFDGLYSRLWTLEPLGVPSVQVDVALPSDLARERLTDLRVRADCGGRFAPFGPDSTGAQLVGWVTEEPGRPAGVWRALGTSQGGLSPSVPGASRIRYPAAGFAPARAFVGPENRMFFRCRPAGGSDRGAAQVGLDYLEVWIGYQSR